MISSIEELQSYSTIIVDAFILRDQKILIQKRTADRKLFPNFWDAFGGHLEPNESIEACLVREIKEESQMDLTEIISLVHKFEWENDKSVINLQFLCRAEGEPILEKNKASEIRWISENEISELGENISGNMKLGLQKAFLF
jgi:8-oxo-dGTP pyrophosphatase MutT (NUDIX family)